MRRTSDITTVSLSCHSLNELANICVNLRIITDLLLHRMAKKCRAVRVIKHLCLCQLYEWWFFNLNHNFSEQLLHCGSGKLFLQHHMLTGWHRVSKVGHFNMEVCGDWLDFEGHSKSCRFGHFHVGFIFWPLAKKCKKCERPSIEVSNWMFLFLSPWLIIQIEMSNRLNNNYHHHNHNICHNNKQHKDLEGILCARFGIESNNRVQYMSAGLLIPVAEEWWEIADLLARLTGGLSPSLRQPRFHCRAKQNSVLSSDTSTRHSSISLIHTYPVFISVRFQWFSAFKLAYYLHVQTGESGTWGFKFNSIILTNWSLFCANKTHNTSKSLPDSRRDDFHLNFYLKLCKARVAFSLKSFNRWRHVSSHALITNSSLIERMNDSLTVEHVVLIRK